jgi:hypothetical protein
VFGRRRERFEASVVVGSLSTLPSRAVGRDQGEITVVVPEIPAGVGGEVHPELDGVGVFAGGRLDGEIVGRRREDERLEVHAGISPGRLKN